MDICRHHHERYDGGGYPDGLAGDEIPLSAQIVAIADVYDALVHERVYKDAIPKEQPSEMIMHGECGAFSPELLQCLTNCRKKMEAL
ncbi:MAG: HD-GYP domain-containing protein, partial [Wujia sp.]